MIASLMLDLCAATVLLLAGLGLWVCVRWMARRLMRAQVMPRLWRRHKARELALTALWRWRIVRHALTGEVGMCVNVCVRSWTLRELLRPTWYAEVASTPELARAIQHAHTPWASAVDGTLEDSLSTALRDGAAIRRAFQQGAEVRRVPVLQMTLAASADAMVFRKGMALGGSL